VEGTNLLDLSGLPEALLDPLVRVVETAREQAPELSPDRIMLVGARCRDIIHSALGHDFGTQVTRDVDLALTLSGWETYERLAGAFPQVGDSGIRFEIAGQNVDLLPFGDLEDPKGVVAPPTREEAMSVWAFEEIYSGSLPLPLAKTLAIRIPTVPGYAAAKLAAWLDRSAWRQTRDAYDLGLVAHWYVESEDVEGRLYDTPEGQQILVAEEADFPRAAARLLGEDVSVILGPERLTELIERWPGELDMLVRNFTMNTGPRWLEQELRRREVIDALTRGLRTRSEPNVAGGSPMA
jgi:predicted nucleotidyltransferase